jgi:glycosyltransferase involved in cell wall biosynthesis
MASNRIAFNADRFINRFFHYPRIVARTWSSYDFFHVVDHSYAHLVHSLPAHRTGVYCHDLDAFRCLIEPKREPRPAWFRAMARSILRGMQKAAVVFHSTQAVRNDLISHGLIEPERLVHAPYGVAPEFAVGGPRDSRNTHKSTILHVGSCIPRKRIDILLQVFAKARRNAPGADLRLLQIGGTWTPQQLHLLEELGIHDCTTQIRNVPVERIVDAYRNAAIVLIPSELEGFGLPVIEALACGAPVVASDIPTLREVGGQAAVYRAVGDVDGWTEAVLGVLSGSLSVPDQQARLAQAALYSWDRHASAILGAYEKLPISHERGP